MRLALCAAAVAIGVVASSCTYQLRDENVSASCAPLTYVINSHGVGLDKAHEDAIVAAVDDFAALVGRESQYLGGSTIRYTTRQPGDPMLIELTWPEDAPGYMGFASPSVTDGEYDSGWMYLNPVVAEAPPGVLYRLVSHEMGHMAGLDDVDDPAEMMNPSLSAGDWGSGDLAGLTLTHRGGCEGSTLIPRLLAAARAEKAGGRLGSLAAPTDTGGWLADGPTMTEEVVHSHG